MEETQEMNMTNKVNIEFLREQLEKALDDIEELKDKVRAKWKRSSVALVALCMFVAGELKEHRIQPAMSDCLKGRGLRERQQMIIFNTNAGKVNAELEENIDGSKAIKKIIEEG